MDVDRQEFFRRICVVEFGAVVSLKADNLSHFVECFVLNIILVDIKYNRHIYHVPSQFDWHTRPGLVEVLNPNKNKNTSLFASKQLKRWNISFQNGNYLSSHSQAIEMSPKCTSISCVGLIGNAMAMASFCHGDWINYTKSN